MRSSGLTRRALPAAVLASDVGIDLGPLAAGVLLHLAPAAGRGQLRQLQQRDLLERELRGFATGFLDVFHNRLNKVIKLFTQAESTCTAILEL